jgi:hypothetical protein
VNEVADVFGGTPSERTSFPKGVNAERAYGSSILRIFACDQRTILPLMAFLFSWFESRARSQRLFGFICVLAGRSFA